MGVEILDNGTRVLTAPGATFGTDALLLATRELRGITVQVLRRIQIHHLHELVGFAGDGLGVALGQTGNDFDVFPNGHVGE